MFCGGGALGFPAAVECAAAVCGCGAGDVAAVADDLGEDFVNDPCLESFGGGFAGFQGEGEEAGLGDGAEFLGASGGGF